MKEALISLIPLSLYCRIKRATFKMQNYREYKRIEKEKLYFSESQYSLKPFVDSKSIFIHIPKCAGMAMNKALYDSFGGGHRGISNYLYLLDYEDFKHYFKFTFVRNPWDRLVSSYFFLKQGGMNKPDDEFFKQNLSQYRDFNDFVLNWLNPENIMKYHHFIPQVTYIKDIHCEVKLDFIGRFENITEDFEFISKKIGASGAELIKSNASERSSYKVFYSDAAVKRVYEVYRDDIETLGYSF